jgi:purine-binding chemotaxis protein CheW
MSEPSRVPPPPAPLIRLDPRASRLPTPPVQTLEVLAFVLATEDYALPLTEVREILKVPPITDVPRAPPDVLGILSLRGTVVTLVDLRRRMGLPESAFDRKTRVLVVRRGEEPMGLLVDAVTEVVRLEPAEIEERPAVPGARHAEYFAGVARPGGSLYVLLNLQTLLSDL